MSRETLDALRVAAKTDDQTRRVLIDYYMGPCLRNAACLFLAQVALEIDTGATCQVFAR